MKDNETAVLRKLTEDSAMQLLEGVTLPPQPGTLLDINRERAKAEPDVAAVARIIERCQLTADDVIFMGSPLAHLTGFLYGMWMPLMLHATMVLQDVWQPETAWRLIGDERVSFAMGATPFLADLTHAEARKAHNSDRFRLFVCGGAPIPRVLAEHAAQELDIDLMAVWGMTENGAVTGEFTSQTMALDKAFELCPEG